MSFPFDTSSRRLVSRCLSVNGGRGAGDKGQIWLSTQQRQLSEVSVSSRNENGREMDEGEEHKCRSCVHSWTRIGSTLVRVLCAEQAGPGVMSEFDRKGRCAECALDEVIL